MSGPAQDIRLTQVLSHAPLLDDGNIAVAIGPGTTIELARELGEGAFGRVYEVKTIDGREPPPCVVKVLLEGVGLSPETSSESIAELHTALASTALPHPAREHLAGVPF